MSPVTCHLSPVPSHQSPVPSPQRCTELVEVSPVPSHLLYISSSPLLHTQNLLISSY
ncbi:hypothetical protein [Sphaerospermopsis sp. FACHB-1194]|uniref:hypothetical protein n=1 Tax=Sphaerospermopsis sp. FACHB-1194 TaxID=2692862 RepID=UPI0016802FB5|nr:hypothetical protein [Sphaerospermopsis sp. FACHB-1194]MBD2146605.1 hypothetical protein [Sphaerospermopsis sp. FACHB-1194]